MIKGPNAVTCDVVEDPIQIRCTGLDGENDSFEEDDDGQEQASHSRLAAQRPPDLLRARCMGLCRHTGHLDVAAALAGEHPCYRAHKETL